MRKVKTHAGWQRWHGVPELKLSSEFLIAYFERPSRPKSHGLDRVIVCVAGRGCVVVPGPDETEVRHPLEPSDMLVIPKGVVHWMEPHEGEVMATWIGHEIG